MKYCITFPSQILIEYCIAIEEILFLYDKGMVKFSSLFAWIVNKVQNGNNIFLELIWLKNDELEFVNSLKDLVYFDGESNLDIKQMNFLFVELIKKMGFVGEVFEKIIEDYHDNNSYPDDLKPYFRGDDIFRESFSICPFTYFPMKP